MNIYFCSKYSSSPVLAPSRPIPLSLIPPNGAKALLITPSFTPMRPFSSLSVTRKIREESLVIIYAAKNLSTNQLNHNLHPNSTNSPRPDVVLLARRIASSSEVKVTQAATGPNVSVIQIFDFLLTFVRIVGS